MFHNIKVMAKFQQTLIPFLSSIFLLLPNKAISQETYFSFASSVSNPTNLTYQGDAHILVGPSLIRLTKTDAKGFPQKLSVGRVLYSKPVTLWERSSTLSFNTTIKFTVTRMKGHPVADGLAFFMAPVGTTIPMGSYGGNLGIFDTSGTSSTGLFAVEFDLYTNYWDPSDRLRHIGIDVNSIKSSNFVNFKDSCVGKEAELKIEYHGNVGMIYVTLKCGKERRLLEYECDLRSILPHQVEVGISASTGDLVALHDINYWTFNSIMLGPIQEEEEEASHT